MRTRMAPSHRVGFSGSTEAGSTQGAAAVTALR
jgi:hypothetical protein